MTTPLDAVTVWCSECGGSSDVESEGVETDPRGDDFWVRRLDCGHEEVTPDARP